ncbi:hypothetical protein ACEPAH_6521 [Sanghuangporus vaninii]
METSTEAASKSPTSSDVISEPPRAISTPSTQSKEASQYAVTTGAPQASSTSEPVKESKNDSTIELSKTSLLRQQIQALASLQTRLARIRSLPAHLLIFHAQSPLISLGGLSGLGLGDGNGSSESDTINSILNADTGTEVSMQAREMGLQARVAFRMINDAKEELAQDKAQGALKASHESEAQDKSEIILHGRRSRKKRRIVTADSPAPFPSFHVETTHVFPPPRLEDNRKVENLEDLVLFIREFNGRATESEQRSRTILAVWAPSHPKLAARRDVSDPLTVRVTIRDVTTVFVKLRHDRGFGQLYIESVVALGPREKKGPHSHSDFTVFQKLTQHVARMLEKEPYVSFSQLVDLLMSYEDLFITHCSVCRRVLPLEGHVPPVARVWKGGSATEGDRGRWEARHISCLHA